MKKVVTLFDDYFYKFLIYFRLTAFTTKLKNYLKNSSIAQILLNKHPCTTNFNFIFQNKAKKHRIRKISHDYRKTSHVHLHKHTRNLCAFDVPIRSENTTTSSARREYAISAIHKQSLQTFFRLSF